MKLQKKPKPKLNGLQGRKEKQKSEKDKNKKQKRRVLDALIGGIGKSDGTTTGSEGDDNRAGDKGNPDGDPYATSYYGSPGSGSGTGGYGLNGRSLGQ